MHYTESDFLETATPHNMELSLRARELTRAYYLCNYRNNDEKQTILRQLLGGMGDNVGVGIPFYCDHGNNIFIGDDVVIGMNCTFVDNERITIGSRVMIAPNVQIYTASHPVHPRERMPENWKEEHVAFFRTWAQPVTIQDGVWIGGGAIILPGVTIGENAVIGAGSVVTKDIPANSVAVGNPCKVVSSFTP